MPTRYLLYWLCCLSIAVPRLQLWGQNVTIGIQNTTIACDVCFDLVLSTTPPNFGCSSWVVDLSFDHTVISTANVSVNPTFNNGSTYSTSSASIEGRTLISCYLNPPVAPFQITNNPIQLARVCYGIINPAGNPNFSILNIETYVADEAFNTLLTGSTATQPAFPTNLSTNNPTNINANSTTHQSANLTWASTGNSTTQYELRYKPVAASDWDTLLATNTSLVLEGLLSCTQYEAQVRAFCANGEIGNYGAITTFTTTALAAWTAPPILQNCTAPIDLNTWITGDSGGTWSGEGVTGNWFVPNSVSPNTYSLTYTVGTGACAASQTQTLTVNTCTPAGIVGQFRVWLGGAYNATTNTMSTQLRDNNWLPHKQPYHIAPWNYATPDSVGILPSNAVDWILIELRQVATNELVSRQAALLLNDGTVRDKWGNAGIYFDVPAISYRIIVRHRNHLAIASANAVALPTAVPYDFSIANNIEGGSSQAVLLNTGMYGMSNGDIDANGVIQVNDAREWQSQNASNSGYYSSDLDLSGTVNIADFNLLQPNLSRIAPSVVRY